MPCFVGTPYGGLSGWGSNVYPENVVVGLEQSAVRDWVTGKFVLAVVDDGDGNRRLQVAVELAPGNEWGDQRGGAIAESIERHLARLNGEYAHYVPPEYRPAGVGGDPKRSGQRPRCSGSPGAAASGWKRR